MNFDALKIALELVAALRPLHAKLREKDPDLARQLKKAGSSIPLNVGEGSRRRGRDRVQHYRIAAGSAKEVLVALLTAEAWGDLSKQDTAAALALADRELAILWRLTGERTS